MTDQHSKSRQQAEIAFGKTQVKTGGPLPAPLPAKSRAREEEDAIFNAREKKTRRLREARKAKEISDIASATAGLVARRSVKS